uniref:Reverse transcriptase n=1 Tax=Angiostrongylus cantonensis TaxID=6313 RepID=A0A158PCI5_ANGCA
MNLEKFYSEDHTIFKVINGNFNAKIGPRSSEERRIETHGLEWNEQEEASAANYLFPGGSVRQAVSEPSLDRNSAEQNSEIIAGVGRRVENADSIRVDEGWLEEVTAREPSFASTDRFESFVDSGYRGSSEIMEN